MSLESKLMELLGDLASGPCNPKDPFFDEGNKLMTHLKKYGIYEADNEDFLHEPVQTFSCDIYGCKKSFDTVFQFEQHYNCCHRYRCCECKKTLATPHLLDLHLSEEHDSYFAAQAEKKAMYQCYVEDCNTFYQNPQLRKTHCKEDHSFPASFWFDKSIKSRDCEKGEKTSKKNKTNMQIDTPESKTKNAGKKETPCQKSAKPTSKMEVTNGEPSKQMEVDPRKKAAGVKVLGSASHGQRQRIFVSFTKDMAEHLPDVS